MPGRPPEESASSPTKTQQPVATGAAISPLVASSNNSTKLSPLPHVTRHRHEVLPLQAVASPLNTVKATHQVPKQSLNFVGSSPAMKTGSIKFERSSTALGAYSTQTNGDASRITISQCMGGSGLLQDSGIAHHNSNKQCAEMLAEGSSLNPGSRPSLNNPTGLHMALTSSASQNRMDVLQDNPSNPRLRLASPGSSNTVPGSAKGGAVVQAVHDCPLKNTSSEEEGHCAITTTSRTSSFSYESDHYVGVATDQPTNGPRANPRASGSAPMPLLSTALTPHQQQQPRPDLQLPMNAHPPDSSTSGRSLQAHPPASRDHFQQ